MAALPAGTPECARRVMQAVERELVEAYPGVEMEVVWLNPPRCEKALPLHRIELVGGDEHRLPLVAKLMDRQGGVLASLVLRSLLEVKLPQLVAKREFAFGEEFDPEGIALRQVTKRPGESFLADPGQVSGMRTRMRIRQGGEVLPELLAPRYLVRRGEIADLLYRGEGFYINLKVEVLADGEEGKVVLVRNPLSGRRLRARVVGEGKLEVIQSGKR